MLPQRWRSSPAVLDTLRNLTGCGSPRSPSTAPVRASSAARGARRVRPPRRRLVHRRLTHLRAGHQRAVDAIENRAPKPRRRADRPSDQGPQCTSWAYTTRARGSGLLASMGSLGDCYDNAVVESFWGRMQTELLDRRRCWTRVELANAMFEHLEIFQNRQGDTPPSARSPRPTTSSHTTSPSHDRFQKPDSGRPGNITGTGR